MKSIKEINSWTVEIEKEITEEWKNSDIYKFNKNTKKKIYSIDTPPPYLNSPIHMGHAVSYSFMDFFARYRRMKNYEVLFPLGLDNNGLPIESAAEKKYNISPFEVGRDKFLEYCKKLLEECGTESIDSFARLGISFNSYRRGKEIGEIYETDSEEYRKLTQKTFLGLYKKGLIYEDKRVNNWDTKLRTTIADAEIVYKEVPSTFCYVKWKVKDTNEEIIIATTRPELICTCAMVIFNPKDERYSHLEGKKAITPIFNKEVPIIPHSLAQKDKGTGLVMMCSAGDLSDIQFFREMGLKPQIAINIDGKMNNIAGPLEGLSVKEARRKIIEMLEEQNLIVKKEEILHRTPISERSNTEVEFIEMSELYLKQIEFKEEIRGISKKIKFYPEEARKILENWIDSINIDWPITRRRFYATPVPLWYSEKDGKKLVAVPKGDKYYQPWKEEVPSDAEVWIDYKFTGKLVKDKEFSSLKWVGDERVFDTWMDSSISELFIIKYKEDEEFFKRAYPITLRPQGKEIVRTWLYYSLLRAYLETKKACFKECWINQHVLDERGKKMSKSIGNVINPQEILKEYGGEALRLWAALEGDLSKGDIICSKEKIKAELKTLNKILNVSKFIMQFEKPKEKPRLKKIDEVFISYMEDLTKRADKCYENYDFQNIVRELRNFLWEDFASHYIEIVKPRAYNDKRLFEEEEALSAKWTLHFLLERFLILIYPVIPQITYFIGKEKGIDLLRIKWPKAQKPSCEFSIIKKIKDFNSLVWKTKKEKGIPLNAEIDGIEIPKELSDFEKDLEVCHKLKRK
ncbi:MAG: valine--tRNA ligase [Candidatus Pacearchaeota archaeon]